jgi:Spy/CpxP family protein refolding chaperone
MVSKTLVLGAAAVCAALASLAATGASADPWDHGWRGGYHDRDDYVAGRSVDQLFAREDRIGDQIRRLSYNGRFNRWEASRAWQSLNAAREQTRHEAGEHGRVLPPDDFYRISARLNELERFIGHEARDFD